MFARQLQISFILLKSLVSVLPTQMMAKFADKLKQIG